VLHIPSIWKILVLSLEAGVVTEGFSNLITKLKGKRPLGRPTNRWDDDTCEDVAEFYDYSDEINVGIIKYRQFTYKATLRLGHVNTEMWKSNEYHIF
jgi:hypothetical protein